MPMLFEPPAAPSLVQIICTKMAILAQIKFRITRLAASLIEKIPSILDEQDKGFSDAFGSTRPIPN